MGGRQTRQQILFNPSSAGFERVQNSSGRTTWLNQLSGEELEEYQFISSNQRQFQYEVDAFNFRHNSPYLVSSLYLREQVQSQICGSTYIGNLFLERIPRRLSELNQIPYPDVLHLYSQAFRGFDLITKQVGPFNVTEDMIGINKSGIVKVWINSDFSKSVSDISIEIRRITEQAMIQRIVEVIHQNTYLPSMSNNIKDFFQQRNPVTLLQAHAVLEEYARLNNTRIPGRLDCFLETFNEGSGMVINTGNTVRTTVARNSVHAPIINPSIVGARQVSQIGQVGQVGLTQTQYFNPVPQATTVTHSQVVPSPITHSVIPPATSSILAPSHSSALLASPSSAVLPAPVISSRPILPTSNSVVVSPPIVQQRPVTSVIPVASQATVQTVRQNVSRNILNQAKSLPVTNVRPPTVGTTSHNVIYNSHVPVRYYRAARSQVHIRKPDQNYTSFVRTENRTKPLFPRVSPVRHASVSKPSTALLKPSVAVTPPSVAVKQPAVTITPPASLNAAKFTNINTRNSNLATRVSPSHSISPPKFEQKNRVGEVHHLFNKKTAGTNVDGKSPTRVNFNSTLINNVDHVNTINTKQYESVKNTTPRHNFKPLSQVKVEEQVSSSNYKYKSNNYNNITERTVTQKYDFSQKYSYKPLTADNIATQTYYQTTGLTGLEGISKRIQQLNDKYKNNSTGSLYVPSTTPLLPSVTTATNYLPSVTPINYTLPTTTNYTPLTTQVNYQSTYTPITHPNLGTYQTKNNVSNYESYKYESNIKTVGGTSYPTYQTKAETYSRTPAPLITTPLITSPYVTGADAYIATQTTYQQPVSFASIMKQETRDIVYTPGETVQSFAVERFAPTINTINLGSSDLLSSFGRGEHDANLASGYITSINQTATLASPYHTVPVDTRYAAIKEQLYETSAQPSRSYQYTSTYSESYHSNNYGTSNLPATTFESIYQTSLSGIPQGAAAYGGFGEIAVTTPIAAKYERETYERESYYLEQQSSKFVASNLQGYHIDLDADIMSDLNRIRTSGTLG